MEIFVSLIFAFMRSNYQIEAIFLQELFANIWAKKTSTASSVVEYPALIKLRIAP